MPELDSNLWAGLFSKPSGPGFEIAGAFPYLYAKWPHLKHLICFIYNSHMLADAEAFEELDGAREISGRRFAVKVVLG